MNIVYADKNISTITYLCNNRIPSELFKELNFDILNLSNTHEVKYEIIKRYLQKDISTDIICIMSDFYDKHLCNKYNFSINKQVQDDIHLLKIILKAFGKNSEDFNVIFNPVENIEFAYGFKINNKTFALLNLEDNDFAKNKIKILHEILHFIVREFYRELTLIKLTYSKIFMDLGINNYALTRYKDMYLIVEEVLVTSLSIALIKAFYNYDLDSYLKEQAHHFGENPFFYVYNQVSNLYIDKKFLDMKNILNSIINV